MKKLMTGAAAVAAMIMVCGTTAFAAPVTNVHYYADANGDGICDYCNASCAFVDANGDGICDNYGTHANCIGAGYADMNGDGMCDNYVVGRHTNGTVASGGHHSTYGGHGHRSGRHH